MFLTVNLLAMKYRLIHHSFKRGNFPVTLKFSKIPLVDEGKIIFPNFLAQRKNTN